MARYGRLKLLKHPVHGLVLEATDRAVLEEVLRSAKMRAAASASASTPTRSSCTRASAARSSRCCSSSAGRPRTSPATSTARRTPIALVEDGWELRAYQREAVEASGTAAPGVVVLPCGAGKTIVGAAAMAQAGATTLILVTNTVAARQWKHELLKRTTLTEDEIGEYSGARKEIRPVTIATYQVMTTRRKGVYAHLELFDERDWGLILYDEVHLLPAPIFRFTADIQSRRRLGLTATLVREDGREGDVFSLIGPKRYDAPWKDIEAQGYIAPADCVEVRVTLHRPRAARLRDGRARGALPPLRHDAVEDAGRRGARRSGTRASRSSSSGSTSTSSTTSASASARRSSRARRTVKERERLFEAFRTGELHDARREQGRELLGRPARGGRRDPGVRARSARGRRRRSGSAGSCGPRPTAARRGSTRSSPATPSTRTSPRTGSGSSPSRATPTASSTPTSSTGSTPPTDGSG